MMNLPENFVTYDEARKAGFMKMKELKEKGAADPCCRDEAAEKPLPVNQGQLWLCADRYLPVFLFRRSDCGGDDLRRKEKDV